MLLQYCGTPEYIAVLVQDYSEYCNLYSSRSLTVYKYHRDQQCRLGHTVWVAEVTTSSMSPPP
jgi:hypothetical protein